jgi:hypothetical protein
VQDEIAYAHRRLAEIRAAAGKEAKIFFLYGNHEARFSKWLAKRAPELVGLTDANGNEVLSLATLLRFDHLDITPCIDEKTIYTGPLLTLREFLLLAVMTIHRVLRSGPLVALLTFRRSALPPSLRA